MKGLVLSMLLLINPVLYCQTLIQGIVTDTRKNPLIGANVYFEGTYEGSTTNEEGYFSLETSLFGDEILAVSYIGYEEQKKPITLDGITIQSNFILKEKLNELNAAVITAGSFEASDKKRSAILKSLDVVTTAGSEGDIYLALNTLPGAQKQQESGKIIVRGGAAHETKTYMDGLLITSPYISTNEDIPARGRFSPFLFEGILFSTGGYSAEYGQALSSVIALNTNGLADVNLTSISLLNVGTGLSHTHRWKNTSLTADANYTNLLPYFRMHKHNLDWEKEPESWEGAFRLNHVTPKGGISKTYVSYNNGHSSLNVPNYSTGKSDLIKLNNSMLFVKTSYGQELNKKWLINTGIAFSDDMNQVRVTGNTLKTSLRAINGRVSLIHYKNEKLTIKTGLELYIHSYVQNIKGDTLAQDDTYQTQDGIMSAFTEGDIKLSNHLALRLGGRAEYATLTDRFNAAPRIATAIKIDRYSQFSLAYGLFYQQAQDPYLLLTSRLDFEQAAHYILNYQYSKDDRIARLEIFYKDYKRLLKFDEPTAYQYENLDNSGHGYARGIDFLWRDNKSLQYADYWISYSFVDSKRDYEDYPQLAPLYFVSKHSLSTVLKYWITAINTQASFTYSWNSGRPYYNPNSSDFMGDRTKDIHSLNGSLSYLTSIFKQFTIIHFSVNNILGSKNIYGYHYDPQQNENGVYASHPVIPYANRTYVLAMFISIE